MTESRTYNTDEEEGKPLHQVIREKMKQDNKQEKEKPFTRQNQKIFE